MAVSSEILYSTNPQASIVDGNFNNTNAPELLAFDSRLYRTLSILDKSAQKTANKKAAAAGGSSTSDTFVLRNTFYPHWDYGSYVSDYNETAESIENLYSEIDQTTPEGKKQLELLQQRAAAIKEFNETHKQEYLSPRAMVHPYALVRLAGAIGDKATVEKNYTYDNYAQRRFYEIDGDVNGQYAKNPTTTKLIQWGAASPKNRTPYSFQDFVFCKHWNKIENNRLITLRRYAAPVTDNIEFSEYSIGEVAGSNSGTFEVTDADNNKTVIKGGESTNPWTPLATAVTYFGESTENKLSEILAFSAKYNWKKMGGDDIKEPIDVNSSQIDSTELNQAASGLSALTSGLGMVSQFMGFMTEVAGGNGINLEAAPKDIPPDPYKNGPYENRIMGPINVIMNTYKRERGLTFTHEGLKITFEYVARPIAGINNKAVLLDLLANMLVLTYSSGTWFGGMWRYKCESPSVYPFKYGDAMNKLHQGNIFGRNGAIHSLTDNVFKQGTGLLGQILPDMFNAIGNFIAGVADGIKSMFSMNSGDKQKAKDRSKERFNELASSNTFKAVEKVIAAKVMKGTTVPYLQNQRALLTGEPVGDWHLTIGNPLNPIAMIGNLIVTDVNITFSDELGPDDFPIGFKAVVTLDHGLGRDRDAIESMFNRGFGRIYTLSEKFRSSADHETRVDEVTGGLDTIGSDGRTKYEETRNTYYGGGTRFIMKTQHGQLQNAGSYYTGGLLEMEYLKSTYAINGASHQTMAEYHVNPWQMGYIM